MFKQSEVSRLALRVALLLALGFAMLPVMSPAAPAAAQGDPNWKLNSVISTGCGNGEFYFNISFNNLVATDTYYTDTIVRGPAGVYMDEYIGPLPGSSSVFDDDWGVFDSNNRGLQTASFPLPAGTELVITVTLREGATEAVISENSYRFICDTGFFAPFGVAGCDVNVSLPAGTVQGRFVAPAAVYSSPGGEVVPGLTIEPGKTYYVTGQDSSGMYRQILISCSLVWVDANTVGPNYEAPWNGQPLPTNVVG